VAAAAGPRRLELAVGAIAAAQVAGQGVLLARAEGDQGEAEAALAVEVGLTPVRLLVAAVVVRDRQDRGTVDYVLAGCPAAK
jgi:hypothetical protein